ncbi:MAG: hypothetical protein UV01_C0002G0065 [Parcubacteria group bacterium GW2011_GWA2_42_14]|nr:MAG: hypothetical protein UV01_C0002G0065 [Parcubacteria group bacterium GW2011_GWA2_42_14]
MPDFVEVIPINKNMSNSTKNLLLRDLVILLFLAFIASGYYFFGDVLRPDLEEKRPGLVGQSSPDLVRKEGRDLSGEVVKPTELPTLPQYNGAPIGTVNEDKSVVLAYPEDVKTKLRNELLDIAKFVSESPDNLDNWLRAGVIKKFFGDYLGARDAWEYASLIRPQNSTSFANLGGLYALYLKDYPKAELSYKKAIENAPGDIYPYTALADLYSSSEPAGESRSNKIIKIIESGLAANPDNQTLLSYLARFYKEQGNFPKALEYYQKVLALDPHNKAVAAEIDALKK